jgi:hypothetical protein
MRKLSNFNFRSITKVPKALEAIENQVRDLAKIIEECEDFDDEDRSQLVENIEWLKHFYERAEHIIKDDE